jgi:hypothetical protein
VFLADGWGVTLVISAPGFIEFGSNTATNNFIMTGVTQMGSKIDTKGSFANYKLRKKRD